MKILTVLGTRPQFIKAAPVSRILRAEHDETIIHTGQHFDDDMSKVFFNELGLPEVQIDLGIHGGPSTWQVGHMLYQLGPYMMDDLDWCIVYGDTNSALAGAMAASFYDVPLAHVEAGVRSGNWGMQEEKNRIIIDQLADVLFCPSFRACENLNKEGVRGRIIYSGDVMLDAVQAFTPHAKSAHGKYALATLHRAETVDDGRTLRAAVDCLAASPYPVMLLVHPRTKKAIFRYGVELPDNIKPGPPVSYVEMLQLIKHARLVMTDSGGVQKEAYWLGVPCVTLRNETEWPETIEAGWNRLVGLDPAKVRAAVQMSPNGNRPKLYGDGNTARCIVDTLVGLTNGRR